MKTLTGDDFYKISRKLLICPYEGCCSLKLVHFKSKSNPHKKNSPRHVFNRIQEENKFHFFRWRHVVIVQVLKEQWNEKLL